MMKYLYRLYQLFICLPLLLVATIITALVTIVGCHLGNGHFWGYYPGKCWGWHQGAFDIFLIYGFLGRNFKWMMKKGLRRIPLVGAACAAAHHIFVDRSGPSKIKATYDNARNILKEGMSVVVFPEGARSFSGHMGVFFRGAFMLADELQLPVVPITINGSFDVKPRTRDFFWVFWHPLKLTIHQPIPPAGQGAENIKQQMQQSYDAVMSGLVPAYQGYERNPNQ